MPTKKVRLRHYNRQPTEKQKRLLEVLRENPGAGPTEIALKVPYGRPQTAVAAVQSPTIQKPLARIRALMEKREKLKDEKFLDKLEEGLEATKRDMASPEDLPDYKTRHLWWRSGMELKGYLRRDEEDDKPQTQILIINAINESVSKGISQ